MLPQDQVNHIFCGLVEDAKKLHKGSPSFSHRLKGQSENKRTHNEAQRVGSVNVVFHQLHFSVVLKQDGQLSKNRGHQLSLQTSQNHFHSEEGEIFTVSTLEFGSNV